MPTRCSAACTQNVLAVNLANQHGSEGILGTAFKEQAERFARVKPGFEVVSFDFHKECGATRYDRCTSLPPLVNEVNQVFLQCPALFTVSSALHPTQAMFERMVPCSWCLPCNPGFRLWQRQSRVRACARLVSDSTCERSASMCIAQAGEAVGIDRAPRGALRGVPAGPRRRRRPHKAERRAAHQLHRLPGPHERRPGLARAPPAGPPAGRPAAAAGRVLHQGGLPGGARLIRPHVGIVFVPWSLYTPFLVM